MEWSTKQLRISPSNATNPWPRHDSASKRPRRALYLASNIGTTGWWITDTERQWELPRIDLLCSTLTLKLQDAPPTEARASVYKPQAFVNHVVSHLQRKVANAVCCVCSKLPAPTSIHQLHWTGHRSNTCHTSWEWARSPPVTWIEHYCSCKAKHLIKSNTFQFPSSRKRHLQRRRANVEALQRQPLWVSGAPQDVQKRQRQNFIQKHKWCRRPLQEETHYLNRAPRWHCACATKQLVYLAHALHLLQNCKKTSNQQGLKTTNRFSPRVDVWDRLKESKVRTARNGAKWWRSVRQCLCMPYDTSPREDTNEEVLIVRRDWDHRHRQNTTAFQPALPMAGVLVELASERRWHWEQLHIMPTR